MKSICSILAKGAKRMQAAESAATTCACNKQLYGFLGVRFACWSARWQSFPADAKAVGRRILSGEITMGEIKRGAQASLPICDFIGKGEFLTAPFVGPSYTYPDY